MPENLNEVDVANSPYLQIWQDDDLNAVALMSGSNENSNVSRRDDPGPNVTVPGGVGYSDITAHVAREHGREASSGPGPRPTQVDLIR